MVAIAAMAQAPPAQPSGRESVPEFVNRLSPEQRQLFDRANAAFSARRFPDSLAVFRQLSIQLPPALDIR